MFHTCSSLIPAFRVSKEGMPTPFIVPQRMSTYIHPYIHTYIRCTSLLFGFFAFLCTSKWFPIVPVHFNGAAYRTKIEELPANAPYDDFELQASDGAPYDFGDYV